MIKLLVVFAAALVLAYLSEQNTKATIAADCRYSIWHDWAYIGLVIVLTLFAGLRTSYNDAPDEDKEEMKKKLENTFGYL